MSCINLDQGPYSERGSAGDPGSDCRFEPDRTWAAFRTAFELSDAWIGARSAGDLRQKSKPTKRWLTGSDPAQTIAFVAVVLVLIK